MRACHHLIAQTVEEGQGDAKANAWQAWAGGRAATAVSTRKDKACSKLQSVKLRLEGVAVLLDPMHFLRDV